MELRFLRHEMDPSQKRLAELIEKSDQTVACWEKGVSKADGPADRLIRLLYESYATDGARHSTRELLERLTRLDADLGNIKLEEGGVAEGPGCNEGALSPHLLIRRTMAAGRDQTGARP